MTIFNYNKGLGWASSGVEYAQAYRAKCFRKMETDSKFIFTDFFFENLLLIAENIGFKKNEIIYMHQYFSDIPLDRPSLTKEEVLDIYFSNIKFDESEKTGNKIRYKSESTEIVFELDKVLNKYVDTVSIYFYNNLIQKDFYTNKKYASQYFSKGTEIYREFFNSNGTVAVQEYLRGDNRIYVCDNKVLYSKLEFIEYFHNKLDTKEDDLIIVDRTSDILPALFKSKKKNKIAVVIHAEHFNEEATNDKYILWNNFYEYAFVNSDDIEFFITSTDKQREILIEQFEEKYNKRINVATIPVGSLDSLRISDIRRKHSFITASRLASEKNIDLLIRAFSKLKEEFPEVTLDIYGEGGMRNKLLDLIRDMACENNIKLKGHQILDEIYKNYECYLTASQSEGFGLTLLEAVGSGLPIVGFNVRYGNINFIKDGHNGFLSKIDKYDESYNVDNLYKSIKKILLMDSKSLNDFHKNSYNIAKKYTDEEVLKAWEKALEGKIYAKFV